MLRDIASNLIADSIFSLAIALILRPYWINKVQPEIQIINQDLRLLHNHKNHGNCDGCEFVRSSGFWRLLPEKEQANYFAYLRTTKNAKLALEMKRIRDDWLESK